MRRPTVLLLVATLAIVAAACSGDYNRYPADATATTAPPTTAPATSAPPSTTPSTTTTTPTAPTSSTVPGATTTTTPLPPGVAPGRLGIVADDGALITARADGSDVATVAEPPAGGTVVQVAWSPDATRLAFSTTTSRAATIGIGGALGDAAGPTTRPITTAPYHLAWSSTQARLGLLRVDTVDTVELATIDAALATAPVRVRSGAPVTAAWSPDGTRLLAIVGDQIVLAPPDGPGQVLAPQPGPGGAPAWLDDHQVLIAIRTAEDQRLVRLDVDTGARQDLLVYTGAISFLPDLTGARIAYQTVPNDGSSGTGGKVSFPHRQAGGDPPTALDSVLAVFDLATGESRQVLDEPAPAFQWSPDGSKLAFMQQQDATSRWRFFTADPAAAGAVVDGPQFVPSPTFVELIQPYFDQLAPGVDWWSPDGTAFAFAGRVQGREGVWVVPTATSAAPTFVHDGEVVAWSPR